MSDTTNTTPESVSLAEQIRIFNQKKIELEKQQKEYEEKMAQLQKELDDKLNDPWEKAKLLKNATNKIEEAFAEYNTNGYSCSVEKDQYGTITKISFNLPGAQPEKTRRTRKKAGEVGHVPPMTCEQFEKIYSRLENNFSPANIQTLLKEVFGGSQYRLQPSLGEIAVKGYNGIEIKSNGKRGRAAGYTKVS